MKNYKKYVGYENSMTPLNEGFFSWLAGLLKNLVKSIFHVNSYDKFVERLNKMPRIIIGLEENGDNAVSTQSESTTNINDNDNVYNNSNESFYIPKRSRRRLYEARSRFVEPLKEASSKIDNLGLDKEFVNKLLSYGNSIVKKEDSNISFSEEQKAKLVELYNNKVNKDKTVETFAQKAESDGEAGVKGFENKDYYTVLLAIKNIVENNNSNSEENKEEVKDNNASSLLALILNTTENEQLKEQIEEFKNKVSKLENDIKILEEEKNNIKEEDKKKLEDTLELYEVIEKELKNKIDELVNSNDNKDRTIEELIATYEPKIGELEQEIDRLKEENEKLKNDNSNLTAELKHMKGEDYKSEFKPITYDDLKNKTKMPSFKNTLITLLQSLNDKTVQLNDKITDEKLQEMRKNIENHKTLPMSDIQVIELAVSDFLNLYSSGNLGLPKPEKGEEFTLADLSKYQNVVSNANPERKFASLYNSLNKVVDIYEDNFNDELKFIRDMEAKYQQEKANNASWNGQKDISYNTIKKMSDNDTMIRGTIDSIIDGCRSLIPNAIMGFFIASPIYKAAEEKINTMLDVLIANEKVIEENKKNPDLQVISVFSDILGNTIKEEDDKKVEEATTLFTEKIKEIVNNEQLKNIVNVNDSLVDIIKSSGVKITQKETAETLFKKLQDNRVKLAFACLYFVYTNKSLKVEVVINNQKFDLFNLSGQQNNQQNNNTQNQQQTQQGESFGRKNNLRKIYDYYIWQK